MYSFTLYPMLQITAIFVNTTYRVQIRMLQMPKLRADQFQIKQGFDKIHMLVQPITVYKT